MSPINIVWFQRDLRLRDHAPLAAAANAGLPVLLVYCFEPAMMQAPDSDLRHWRFAWQSLEHMRAELDAFGHRLLLYHGEVVQLFEVLLASRQVDTVFSYEETGNAISFRRDLSMKKYFKGKGIKWMEFPSNGVIRGSGNRQGWREEWEHRMNQPLSTVEWKIMEAVRMETEYFDPTLDSLPDGIRIKDMHFQPGGEAAAWQYLDGFVKGRGKGYARNLSKPEQSRYSCSRLSPYLAWGNLSVRQVYQVIQHAHGQSAFKPDLRFFVSRLYWHCHFIQKFESECRMESENLNPGFDTIRKEVDPALVLAWQEGRTGIPMVDACMRCVRQTGYLNFRMRTKKVRRFNKRILVKHTLRKDENEVSVFPGDGAS